MKKLNICLIAPAPPPYGGIAHWTAMITAFALARSDVEIDLIDTAPRWRPIHRKGRIYRVAGGGLQMLRDIYRLVKSIARKKYDAIHLTTSGQLATIRDYFVSVLARAFRLPLTYHLRFGRIPEIASKNSLEWRILLCVMRRSCSVIVIDNATFQVIKQYAPDVNLVLLPNCVATEDLPKSTAKITGQKTALFVGWVIPEKGLAELVQAWANLEANDWRLIIVGPGSVAYQRELLAKFRPQRLEFLGELPHPEVMKLMANTDLFVLPSYTEGFPNAVVEAMALGRPIIASSVGAIPEMLADGAGWLVKAKDPVSLLNAFNAVLGDVALRADLGEKAKSRAMSKYTVDVVFAEYMKIWRDSTAA